MENTTGALHSIGMRPNRIQAYYPWEGEINGLVG